MLLLAWNQIPSASTLLEMECDFFHVHLIFLLFVCEMWQNTKNFQPFLAFHVVHFVCLHAVLCSGSFVYISPNQLAWRSIVAGFALKNFLTCVFQLDYGLYGYMFQNVQEVLWLMFGQFQNFLRMFWEISDGLWKFLRISGNFLRGGNGLEMF